MLFRTLALAATVLAGTAQADVTKVTGCSCNGYSYTYTNKFGESTTYDVLFRKNTDEKPTSNPHGWCFRDGIMTDSFQQGVKDAVSSGISNNVVNASWALYECQQLSYSTNDCASEIISIFTRALLGLQGASTTYITQDCNYPASNFMPLDCQCAFECDPGYVLCGEGTSSPSCIDPNSQACVSGLPVNKNARRRLSTCPRGLTYCPNVFGSGFDCLDTTADLEACGGCPGEPGSVDCSAIPGVSVVSCIDSQCVIEACDADHQLVDGECVHFH